MVRIEDSPLRILVCVKDQEGGVRLDLNIQVSETVLVCEPLVSCAVCSFVWFEYRPSWYLTYGMVDFLNFPVQAVEMENHSSSLGMGN